jgi:hypothetical protein
VADGGVSVSKTRAPLASAGKLLAWVEDYADREGLDAQRALFLDKFARFADAAMESWSKVDTLTRLCRCSERMLQKMREEMVAAGVLELTGRFHTLEDSGRKVPLYRWKLFLDELADGAVSPAPSGARGAPETPARVHETEATGAQGVHPQIEPREPTPSDEGETRAREREALLSRIEAAVDRASLGHTIRDQALAALGEVLAEGFDGEALVAAAAAWKADPAFKRKDLGLQYWLRDRRFRRWLPGGEGEAAAPASGPPAVKAFDGPPEVEAALVELGGREVGKWLVGAVWREADRTIETVSGTGRDKLVDLCGKRSLGELAIKVVKRGGG